MFIKKELESDYPPFSEEVLQAFLKEEMRETVEAA
jgi:hypothetical protein